MATRRRYLDIPDHKRRDFIKWTIGLGAALGLRPWKVFEVQESVVGAAVAAQASCSPVNRFVGFVGGNGGHAWVTQLWPHVEIASKAGASFYATGQAKPQSATLAAGEKPLVLAPDAPSFGGKKMTAFVAGKTETHTNTPTSTVSVATGVSAFAAAAALQTAQPTLVPSILVSNLANTYGTANGAPGPASVPNAAGMVDLFNSAAASANGALNKPADAQLFEAYYKANLQLFAAAGRPTMTPGVRTGKVAANLLGENLADQLRPSAADLSRYGAGGAPAKLASIANTLITTAKAFKLGLTSHVSLPIFQDDPHGAFGNMQTLTSTVKSFGAILDAFMGDLMAEDDPTCAGHKMGDNTVLAFCGDTPKDSLNPSGWGDGTAGNSNYFYVLGNGYLKPGWFGQLRANGTVETFDPTSGNVRQQQGETSLMMAPYASAALLYAVSKGDMRRVSDFYRGPGIDGLIVPLNM